MREHLEVINHQEAVRYIQEIVITKEPLSQSQIKSIHRLVLKGIDDKHAGVYLDQQVSISGAEHIPPEPFLLKEKMEELVKWHEGEAQQLHPVERAAKLHAIFVGIHPFIDGNGRTSRLLLNLDLMKSGFPPIVIKAENRLAYYGALDKAHITDDFQDFVELVEQEVNHTLDLYLSAVK
ncbi:Fic family protein [Domibacillus indicus]|uniref:Fic family protein n=1 Tax=Domibacillus indicus TaxID=1437523 RepID=UPI0020408483|nr:Fic family protein [Domibacillus indicus]